MPGSTTVVNHAGSALSDGAQHGLTLGSGGRPDGAKGGKRPLPHIDDIVNVGVDLDPRAPIEKLLQIAETYLKQAESATSFGRPDLALKEYIRTNIVVCDIQKNKGWVSLQHDNKTQFDRYQRLVRQIDKLDGDFKKIKAIIKADNARSGVQPTVSRASLGSRGQERVNSAAETRSNGVPDHLAASTPKAKPVVHPKPQALHGNALQPAGGASSGKTAEDLEQRFARLRTSTANSTQDPRIRTQSIVLPNISKSPASVEIQRSRAPPVSSLVGMPRPPDAIYNPPRGTISKEAAELPSSAPRAMFTRTNSSASIPSVSKAIKPPPAEEYFVPAQSFSGITSVGSTPIPPERPKRTIPGGRTITAPDLVKYMRAGAKDISILIIDIRSRELFDEGHIMSQATICVEAEVLSRKDISANDIAESMVLAPASEQLLFEERHKFDLVVFYDQESTNIVEKRDTPEQKAISGLYLALSQYDFPGASMTRIAPRLLEGGLEAWMGLVGKTGLQTSSTSPTSSKTTNPMARSLLKKRPTYLTRPIQDAEEAKKWEKTIADLGAMTPVRTTQDFLRRMQEAPARQESMTSPTAAPLAGSQSTFEAGLSPEKSFFSAFPSPPTRPPPTVVRRSYSGLAETETGEAALAKKALQKASVNNPRQFRTGLTNPGVHCFANSIFQALFATPGLGREIATREWETLYKNPPKRANETIPNPQLMMKVLSVLFQHLDSGACKWLEPKVTMDYIRDTHTKMFDKNRKQVKRPAQEVFGGPAQQDAHELCVFILANIHDETNMLRDRGEDYGSWVDQTGNILEIAMAYWSDYSRNSASIVDKYFRSIEVWSTHCQNPSCNAFTYQLQVGDIFHLNFPYPPPDQYDFEELLARDFVKEKVPTYGCDKCWEKPPKDHTGPWPAPPGGIRSRYIARFPDCFIFTLTRFEDHFNHKTMTKVTFPIRGLDLTRFSTQTEGKGRSSRWDDSPVDPHFAGRMLYDCYAIVAHHGVNQSGGHYVAYVQDEQSRDPTDWFKCDDTRVSRVKVGSNAPGDITEHIYRNGTATAYMMFYRRRTTVT